MTQSEYQEGGLTSLTNLASLNLMGSKAQGVMLMVTLI